MTPFIVQPTGTYCAGEPATLEALDCVGIPEWQQVSGSGNATFSAPTAATTDVTVDQPGSYTFVVTCSEDLPAGEYCAGEPFLLEYECPPGTASVQWSQVAGTGNAVFTNPRNPSTYVTVTEPGNYQFQIICKVPDVTAPPVVIAPIDPPVAPLPGQVGIDCPMSVYAGDPITINAYGCDPGQSTSALWQVTGDYDTTSTFNAGSFASVTIGTTSTTVGPITVEFTCTALDGTVTTLICSVAVRPLPLVGELPDICESHSENYEIENCGLVCSSSPVTVVFLDCGLILTSCAYITITIEDCAPCA